MAVFVKRFTCLASPASLRVNVLRKCTDAGSGLCGSNVHV